jgi:hypothetical protein
VEGNTGGGAAADDTYATAHDLGDITNAGLRQAAGTIGDDPWYDYNSPDPLGIQSNPSNDVDLYHFTLSGPGNYVLTAETFAGRIGSPLLPQNTLYQVTTNGLGQKVFTLVGSNAGSLNATQYTDTNGLTVAPFANDPVLYAGLQAGDYVLAVSTVGNQPDLTDLDNGTSHNWSGGNGTTGDYVLNLLALPDSVLPQVQAVSVAEGTVLSGPLTTFTVQFNTYVNIPAANAVFVVGSDNQSYAARLTGYDEATNTASFLMLDGLPVGASVLHLSGSAGITDLFNNPLAGNPTGDYVVHFTVGGPVRGTGGAKPLVWNDQGPGNTTQGTAQVLGPLFPLELQNGVTIQRNFVTDPASPTDTNDYFQFQLLQSTRVYGFNLTNLKGGQVTLIDANNHVYSNIDSIPPNLGPGTYWLHVTGWAAGKNKGTYGVQITLGQSGDNPPPLTAGAAPAVRVTVAALPANPPAPPPSTPTAPPASPPSTPSPVPSATAGSGAGTPQSPAPGPTVGPTLPPTTFVVGQLTSSAPPTVTPAVIDPGNSGLAAVVPAVLRLTSGDAGGLTSLPGGSLIVLSTGPLGGVRGADTPGTPAGFNRLVLPGGDDSDPTAPASPALFVKSGMIDGGGDELRDFIDWDLLLQGYRRLLDGLWRVGVEELPAEEGGDELESASPGAPCEPLSAAFEDAAAVVAWSSDHATTGCDHATTTGGGESAVAFAPSDGTWRSLATNRLWAPGLFALGLLGVRGREDRRAARPSLRQGPRGRNRNSKQ